MIFPKWKLTVPTEEQFNFVSRIEEEFPGINLRLKPNLDGHLILVPKDVTAVESLSSLDEEHLHYLDPEKKKMKVVLTGYPLHFPLQPILRHGQVVNATRCKSRTNMPTRQVIVEVEGSPPSEFELEAWGTYQSRAYRPEPLRCYNCQRFGHHKDRCFAESRCGICSGYHATQVCIDLHKDNKTTTAKCPNCNGSHHAWNNGCPARLAKIRPSNNSTKFSPAPLPTTSAWASGPPAWTRSTPDQSDQPITLTTSKLVGLLTTVVELARLPNADVQNTIFSEVEKLTRSQESFPALSKESRFVPTVKPRSAPRRKINIAQQPIRDEKTPPSPPITSKRKAAPSSDSEAEINIVSTSPEPEEATTIITSPPPQEKTTRKKKTKKQPRALMHCPYGQNWTAYARVKASLP